MTKIILLAVMVVGVGQAHAAMVFKCDRGSEYAKLTFKGGDVVYFNKSPMNIRNFDSRSQDLIYGFGRNVEKAVCVKENGLHFVIVGEPIDHDLESMQPKRR